MNLFVFILFVAINIVYCDIKIKEGELELEQIPPVLPFTPIVRELIGSDIYIHTEFPSDIFLICGLKSTATGPVEYKWEVFGANYSYTRLDEIELRQINRNVVVKCIIKDSINQDEAISRIIAVADSELPDKPSLPVFKLNSDKQRRYITERITVSEGSDLNISCISYSGLTEHRTPTINRGDGLTVSNRINFDQKAGETVMTVTGVTERESGVYICSVDDFIIQDSVRENKLISCLVIEVVSCPTFPVFTIPSAQSVRFGSPLTLQCYSTTKSTTKPYISIIHSNTNGTMARGYNGLVEYHIQSLSRETAVEYDCVATNECGTRSTSIEIDLCPALSTLQHCVSPCPKDCSINETERFNCLVSTSRTCTPGCQCVAGHSLYNGKCVPDYDCPDGYPEVSITGSESRINFNTLDLCESDFSYSLLCEARPVDRTNLLFYKKEGSFSRDQFLSVADNGSLILTGVGTRLGHEGIYICEGNMSGRISQSSIKLNVIPSVLQVELTTEFSHLPATDHGLYNLLYCRILNVTSTKFRYSWYKNSIKIEGAYLPVYRDRNINEKENINYSCEVSHKCGGKSNDNTSVMIMSESLWHWIEPLDTSAYVNDTISLVCRTDNQEVRLEWGNTILGFDLLEDERLSISKEIINGTETITLTILRANLDHSGTYLCSACVAMECDSFPPTNRRVISTEVEVLERGDSCIAGDIEYTDGDTFYVVESASCLDMVLLVDLSTSMSDAIHWLANVSALLETRLIGKKEFRCEDRFGIATFAFNPDGMPRPLTLSNNRLFGTAEMLRDDIEKFRYSGTIEDGYWGIETVIDKYDFRQEARKLIVLLTDEERDKERKYLNFSAILELLNSNGITLYSIVEEQFEVKFKGELYRAIGLDEKGTAYIQDPLDPHGYIKVPNGATQMYSSYQTTHEDYVSLSHATGGASWDITLIEDNLSLYALALLDALFEDSIKRISCSNCSCARGELDCVALEEFSEIPECIAEEERLSLFVSPTEVDLEVHSSFVFTAVVNIPGAVVRWHPTSTFGRIIQHNINRVNSTQYAITVSDVREYYEYTKYSITAQIGTISVSVSISITVRSVKLMMRPTYVSIYQGGDLTLVATLNTSYPDVTWIWYYSPFSFHYAVMLSSRNSEYVDSLQLDSDRDSVLKLRGVKLGGDGYYIAVPVANQSSDVYFEPRYVKAGVELTAISLNAWALKTESNDPKILTVPTGSTGQFFAAELSLPINATFSWYHVDTSSQLTQITESSNTYVLGHVSILTLYNATRELQGVWVVSAELGDGTRLTAEVFLVVTQLSAVDLYIDSVDLVPNSFPVLHQTITLRCIAQGDPNPMCTLEREGSVIISDYSPISYTIDRIDRPHAGAYSCVCRNPAGEKKDTFTLNIGCATETSARPYHHGYAGRVCRRVQVSEEQIEAEPVSSCVVYFLDESKSMENEHVFIKNITTLIPILGNNNNTKFAVVVFGSYDHVAGEVIPMDSNGRIFGNAIEAQEAIRSVKTRGRREDAYLAMITQLDKLDLSFCSNIQFLLITDEDRDEILVRAHPELTYTYVRNKLREYSIVLHVVVKEMYAGPDGEQLFGMDYNGIGYLVESGGKVDNAHWIRDSAHGDTNIEYTQLAFELNGSAWDISKLRRFELREGFASALVSQIRSTFQTACEVCTCFQGNYSCFAVGNNETQHRSTPVPNSNLYLPDENIFYQPSNPVISHGDSLTIKLLHLSHTSTSATSIVSSYPGVELIDTFIYIYDVTQYENIFIDVSVEMNERILNTEFIVFVIPCSVKQTDNCTSTDLKKEYLI